MHVFAIGYGLVFWNRRAGSIRNPAGGSLGHPVAKETTVSYVIMNLELSPSGDVPSTHPFSSKKYEILIVSGIRSFIHF